MSKTYRVGIIGSGGMGHYHARDLIKRPHISLVAAMDIDEGSANGLAEEFSIPAVYTDYNQMLTKEDMDIVIIATWQGVRAEIAIAAANAGVRGILAEKPMAACLGEADDMIETCEAKGAKLAIGHQRRFISSNTEIRRLVAEGAIGQPTIVHHRAKPNGGLLNIGTHLIDEWRYILSDPQTRWVIGQVSRTTDRWERRCICEDLCMGLICFEDGTRGVYEGDLPEPKVSMPTIIGTEGKIKIGDGGVVLLHRDNEGGWKEINPPDVQTDQYQELIDWMEGRCDEHRASGRQARHTMEIMMAIYESLRVKGIVTMPLKTRKSPLDLMVKDGTLPVLKEGRYDIRRPFPEQK